MNAYKLDPHWTPRLASRLSKTTKNTECSAVCPRVIPRDVSHVAVRGKGQWGERKCFPEWRRLGQNAKQGLYQHITNQYPADEEKSHGIVQKHIFYHIIFNPVLHTTWLDHHALTFKVILQNIILVKNPVFCIPS